MTIFLVASVHLQVIVATGKKIVDDLGGEARVEAGCPRCRDGDVAPLLCGAALLTIE